MKEKQDTKGARSILGETARLAAETATAAGMVADLYNAALAAAGRGLAVAAQEVGKDIVIFIGGFKIGIVNGRPLVVAVPISNHTGKTPLMVSNAGDRWANMSAHDLVSFMYNTAALAHLSGHSVTVGSGPDSIAIKAEGFFVIDSELWDEPQIIKWLPGGPA